MLKTPVIYNRQKLVFPYFGYKGVRFNSIENKKSRPYGLLFLIIEFRYLNLAR